MKLPMRSKTLCGLVAMTSLVVAGVLNVRAAPLQSQGGPFANFHELLFKGYQADSTSPFFVQGDLIGRGVWRRTAGPVLGPAVTLPNGATSQSEYGQFLIEAQDGSTLTADVYGTRSTPVASVIAHTVDAVYTPVSGTGRFQGTTGSGPVTITTYSDGSQLLALVGFARLAR